jgi:hypothetical protein
VRRAAICIVAVAVLAGVAVIVLRPHVYDGTIRELDRVSQKGVLLPLGQCPLRDVMTSLEKQAGVKFDVGFFFVHTDLDKSLVRTPSGNLPFWQSLGELSVTNDLHIESFGDDEFTVEPNDADALGYAAVGPALLVLRANPPEKVRERRYLSLYFYFHEWELASPELARLSLTTKDGTTAAAESSRPYQSGGFLKWDILLDRERAAKVTSIQCEVKAKVRSELVEVDLPFGVSSAARLRDMFASSLPKNSAEPEAILRLNDDPKQRQALQNYEFSWDSGLSSTDEQRMSDILGRDMPGRSSLG